MSYALTLGTASFFIAVIWGHPLIALLKRWQMGKQIRLEQPKAHQAKSGTPTMGGVMIVIPVLLITGVLNIVNLWGLDYIGNSTLILFFCLGSHAILGAIDDWQGVKGIRGRGEGMSARTKSSFQIIFAVLIGVTLYYGPPQWDYVGVPGVADFYRVGIWIIPATVLVIVGTSNAVNLTDGLDSLAGSISSIAFACYGLTLMAFLWYNAHPAQLFMGDTGSLSLGATLGLVALMTGQWLLLPVIGFVFFVITCSVIIQVSYFKITRRLYGQGRRVFRMTPLHHHFELVGWSEMQIKERFWLIAVLSGMLGVALALV